MKFNIQDEIDDATAVVDTTLKTAVETRKKKIKNYEDTMKKVTPEKQKEPKLVKTDNLKKMKLGEELFNESTVLNEEFSPTMPKWLKEKFLADKYTQRPSKTLDWARRGYDISNAHNNNNPSNTKWVQNRGRYRGDMKDYVTPSEYGLPQGLLGEFVKAGIDLEHANFISPGIPANKRDKYMNDPYIPILLVKAEATADPFNTGYQVYATGINDKDQWYSDNWAFGQKTPKQLLDACVDFCCLDKNDPSTYFDPANPNQQGFLDIHNPRVQNQEDELQSPWHRFPPYTSGIDKSGYKLPDPEKYEKMLELANRAKGKQALTKYYDELNFLQSIVLDYVETVGLDLESPARHVSMRERNTIFGDYYTRNGFFGILRDACDSYIKIYDTLEQAENATDSKTREDLLDEVFGTTYKSGTLTDLRTYIEKVRSKVNEIIPLQEGYKNMKFNLTEDWTDENKKLTYVSFYKPEDFAGKTYKDFLDEHGIKLVDSKPAEGTEGGMKVTATGKVHAFLDAAKEDPELAVETREWGTRSLDDLDGEDEESYDDRNTLWNKVFIELAGDQQDGFLIPVSRAEGRYTDNVFPDGNNLIIYAKEEKELDHAKRVADFFALDIDVSPISGGYYKATVFIPENRKDDLPTVNVDVTDIVWDLEDEEGKFTAEELDLPSSVPVTVAVAKADTARVRRAVTDLLWDEYRYHPKKFNMNIKGALDYTGSEPVGINEDLWGGLSKLLQKGDTHRMASGNNLHAAKSSFWNNNREKKLQQLNARQDYDQAVIDSRDDLDDETKAQLKNNIQQNYQSQRDSVTQRGIPKSAMYNANKMPQMGKMGTASSAVNYNGQQNTQNIQQAVQNFENSNVGTAIKHAGKVAQAFNDKNVVDTAAKQISKKTGANYQLDKEAEAKLQANDDQLEKQRQASEKDQPTDTKKNQKTANPANVNPLTKRDINKLKKANPNINWDVVLPELNKSGYKITK